MDRRLFFTNVLTGIAGLGSISAMQKVDKFGKITILHTNDTHSHIDSFPVNHSKFPNRGGVNMRKAMVDKVRAEEEIVLLLDAGDIFQGTPYFNMYGGELEFKVMSAMGYDAATIGNHDFDAGIEGFYNMMPHAKFPFLCANYDFSNTVLAHKTLPFKIFRKGKYKIGVFGIGVELNGLVSRELYKETQYLDPIKCAQSSANILKNDHKCNIVICLSHLGYKHKNQIGDIDLAKQTDQIDLIIGGHTHTFMDRPEMHKNKSGHSVVINQVGWAGLLLGRVDFYMGNQGKAELWTSNLQSTNIELKS